MSSRSRAALCLFGLMVAACQAEKAPQPAPSPSAKVPASPARPSTQSSVLTCDYPVRRDDTEASLRARYGSTLRAEAVGGPEGTELSALVLWPDDPTRRAELIFDEDDHSRFGGLRVTTAESKWRVAGIGIASPVDRVEKANGRRFTIAGFEWDYGGNADLRDGALTRLPGGCGLSLRFDPKEDAALPDKLVGDGVQIPSDDSRLRAAGGATVSEIFVFYDHSK